VSLDEPVTSRFPQERLSLLAKVAVMYHEQGMRQPQIAERLHMSQSRISRLLKEAVETGVVRTIVVPPAGTFPEVEEAVRERYGLLDVVVTDVEDAEDQRGLLSSLGSAAAAYLETTLTGGDRIGISSWSATLLATVEAMAPRATRVAQEVVQVIGGVGRPGVQVQATRLTDRLARITGATPRYLPAPGLVPSALVRDGLMEDPGNAELSTAWSRLTLLLAGIGSLSPSPLLASSGNGISELDMEQLRPLGAVGDVCLRFFDAEGSFVDNALNDRVVGIDLARLRAVPRRIGVAGGPQKYDAILGAVRGQWVNVLITDLTTARRLAAE
jgi:DNA-binding transcriptional regulator LsrR (DeoR family)